MRSTLIRARYITTAIVLALLAALTTLALHLLVAPFFAAILPLVDASLP